MKLVDVIGTALTNLRWIEATETFSCLLELPIMTLEVALLLDGVEQIKAVRSGCHEIIGCSHVEEDDWNTGLADRLRGIVSDVIPTLAACERDMV